MISVDTAKNWYQDTVTHSYETVLAAQEDRDFKDGKQWSSDELKELKRRNQPPVVDNIIKGIVDSLKGFEIQSRTDIKGFPRNPNDEGAAEAATDALRFIADNNNFDQIKTEVSDYIYIEGQAAAITEVVKKGNQYEVTQTVIPFDRYFIDKHSRRLDGKDKKYDGIALWMDKKDAMALYPEADESAFLNPEDGEVHEDRPEDSYYDAERDRVKVIEMFYNDKGWHRCVFTGGNGFIVEPHPSPYLDEDGEPSNPIETARAFLDRDNNPYGVVRQLKPLQREINSRRSRALHLLNTRQIIMEDGAVDNVTKARREAAKADGVLVRNKGFDFEINNNNDLAQGQLALLEEAKSSAQASVLNPSLTGDEPRNLSGRALQARQQGATLEITPLLDQGRDWQKRMYRQKWARVKQFWNEERWVRVTDDERNLKFIGLNRPVTAAEVLMQEEGGEEIIAQLQGDPRLNEVVSIENPTSELDLDIILEDVPDTVNIQSEQFELLANLAQANPDAIPFEMIIEASSIRNKNRILERLKGGSPEEQQAAQQRLQTQERAQNAAIAKDEAKAELDMSNAYQAKVETELAIAGREAL